MVDLRAFGATVMCFSLLLVSSTAAAQSFEECQGIYDKGHPTGQYQEAYICYKKGYEATPNFKWAANLGNVEIKLRKFGDAIPHLEFALANVDPADPNAARIKTNVRAKIAEATANVAVVTVNLTPAGATGASIAINGNIVGTAPLNKPIILDAGNYKLTATRTGFQDLAYDIVAQPNTSPTLNLQMTPGTSSASRGSGGVSTTMIAVAVVGGVLALGGIGAGIGLHVAASGKGDERESTASALTAELGTGACSDPTVDARCGDLQTLSDDESTFSAAGTAMLIVGGVLAVGTVLTVVLWPSSSSSSTGRVWMAPNPGGLTLGGSF